MQKVICFFRKNLLYTLLSLFFIPFVVVLFYHMTGVSVGQLYTFGIPDLKDFYTFWIATFGVIGVAYNISLNQKRITHQETQISQQNKMHCDQRFAKGLELLGDERELTRIGAAYSLYFLARDFPNEYKRTVFDILCSHVRMQTATDEYEKDHVDEPSNEIQTVLNLLSKEKDGCFLFEDLEADLNYTYLVGIDLCNAHLREANLIVVDLRGADLVGAHLSDADLSKADLSKADLREVNLSGARLWDADLSESDLGESDLIGADLSCANLTGADLTCVKYDNKTIFMDVTFTDAFLSGDLKEKLGL